MFNIAVAQSGGPTAAINASLTGVFNGAEQEKEVDEIYGAKSPFQNFASFFSTRRISFPKNAISRKLSRREHILSG